MSQLFSGAWIMALGALLLPISISASVSADAHWDNQFGPAGVNASAFAIATIRNNIYVGGASITIAGNTKANAVAGFDGTNWFPLNSGFGNLPIVVGVASDSNYLYVGGIFTNADDPNIMDAARWDGSAWSYFGLKAPFYTVKRNGTNLYFGGVFTSAGGIAATNIARWDGTSWYPLGPGLNGPAVPSAVTCITFQGTNVYAGGTFAYAGSLNATNVAYFDGNAWHAMGNSLNGPVTALMFYGGYLYAGGAFTNVSLGVTNLARWTGSAWQSVPGGGANKQVEDFASDGTNLFVGGLFTQVGGIAAAGVASFDGTTWSALGSGVHFFQGSVGQVNKMLWSSNQLYVAGGFERAGNVGANDVARWDGSNWSSLGGAVSKGMPPPLNNVNSLLAVSGPSLIPTGLYAGGAFTEAGDVLVNSLGLWDGTNWNAVGGGVSGKLTASTLVRALATDGTYLYAAGDFTNAGGNAASEIAYWDGNNWSAMGGGVDWVVNALAFDNFNYLYVGGIFTNVDGGYSRGFGVWANGNWSYFGNVEGSSAAVNSIVFDGVSKVFLGGSFFSAGGVSATNVAYFDNTDFSWHSLDPGFDAKVNGLAYGNGILYACGSFTKAGALTLNHVAQWDGTSWSAMGSGMTGGSSIIVNSMLVVGTSVYATGNFTNAGGVIATNIAKWNGSSWSPLGSGLEVPRAGFAMAAMNNDLFVGGNFSFAGDKPAAFIARWNDQSNFYPTANMKLTRTAWLTNRQYRFRVTGSAGQSFIIQGTTNLKTWTPLQTNSTLFYDFTDTSATNYPSRYYRATLAP